jgi:DNA-binding MarR family transcriptional regulator
MPRSTDPMLGDDLVDAYRAFVMEIYDALSADGFPDLPQAATTVFRDIDGRGSLVTDLAVQAGYGIEMMWAVVRQLEASGYVEVEDGRARPAERGHAAFASGRRALAAAEERLRKRVGEERFVVFRDVLREIASPVART